MTKSLCLNSRLLNSIENIKSIFFQVCLSHIWMNGKHVGEYWLSEKELCGWRDLGNIAAPDSALQLTFQNSEFQGCKED